MRVRTAMPVLLAAFLACASAGCGGKPDGGGAPSGGPPRPGTVDPEVQTVTALLPAPEAGSSWSLQEVEEWTAAGEALYDRIDGAAEVYLQYDFKAAAHRRFIRNGDVNTYIDVTLYWFGSADEAFGAYSLVRDPEATGLVDLGDAAVDDDGAIHLWQGRAYAHIVASNDSKEVHADQMQMAYTIERNVGRKAAVPMTTDRRSRLPALFDLLPSEERLAGTERYAHTALSLMKTQAGFAAKPLGLSRETDLAAAEYGPQWDTPAAERNRVFVLRYPSARAAEAALRAYLADTAAQQSRIGQETQIEREGAYLVGSWRKSVEAQRPVIPKVLARIRGGPASRP